MNHSWYYQKGIYNPPTIELFPNLIKKEINITSHIHDEIGKIIGKDGKNFINLTKKYELLYIFYIENRIELYGVNEFNLYGAIHEIIRKIKYMNYLYRKKTIDSNIVLSRAEIQA